MMAEIKRHADKHDRREGYNVAIHDFEECFFFHLYFSINLYLR